jgi:hypothetical protein
MNRLTVLWIATDRSINLRADCHRPDLTACIPGNLSRAWQSAVHLRAVCQRVIPDVAICGFWLWNLFLSYFCEKCFEISTFVLKSCTKIGIPMPKSKFRYQNRNRNSVVEIETEIEIPISTWKPKSKFQFQLRNQNRNSDFDIEISTKSVWNFDFVESKQWKLKPKSKLLFRHRNQNRNFGKSKHWNFDEIRIKFRRNFDFVESKKNTTFVETLTATVARMYIAWCPNRWMQTADQQIYTNMWWSAGLTSEGIGSIRNWL